MYTVLVVITMSFVSKVVIVTGGAQGLGKTFCERLLDKGAKVCFCDINQLKGIETLQVLRDRFGAEEVEFIQCDVTDSDNFKDVFKHTKEKFGTIGILINNAGLICEGPEWKRCVSINLVAVIEGCKIAEEYMSKLNGGKGGTILNMASIIGLILPASCIPVYGATKAGVIGLTRCLSTQAEELKTGIKYVSICPGPVDTTLLHKLTTTEGMTSYGIDKIPPMQFTPEQIETMLDGFPKNVIQTDHILLLRTENVVDTGVMLLETENNNGSIMSIIATKKCEYMYGGPGGYKV